jgi:hypothetical protein
MISGVRNTAHFGQKASISDSNTKQIQLKDQGQKEHVTCSVYNCHEYETGDCDG